MLPQNANPGASDAGAAEINALGRALDKRQHNPEPRIRQAQRERDATASIMAAADFLAGFNYPPRPVVPVLQDAFNLSIGGAIAAIRQANTIRREVRA